MTALLVVLSFTPFNSSLVYPGDQAGKGAVPASFGCISAGNTALDASGNMQVLYAAFDEAGSLLWSDSVHWGQSTEILSVTENDAGMVFNGSSSNPSTSEDALAWALSPDLQEEWTFILDLPLQERFSSSASGEGGITVCAGSTNSIGAGGNDVLMVAVDGNGEQVWRQTYGTSGEEAVYHISECSDGGFVMACQAMDWGAGNGDYWIIRTDSQGDTLWTGTYGGQEFDYPWRVLQSGEYFYVAGNTLSYGQGSYDWWILKLDSSGELVWQKTWGGENTDTCMALETTPSGIVAGGMSEPVLNMFQATAVEFDGNGNVTGEWYYQPGMIRSITAVNDGGFLMGGSVYSPGGDIWVACVDSTGYAPEMGLSGVPAGIATLLGANPVSSVLTIHVPQGGTRVTVMDLAGRVLRSLQAAEGEFSLNISELPEGIYTVYAGNRCERFAVVR